MRRTVSGSLTALAVAVLGVASVSTVVPAVATPTPASRDGFSSEVVASDGQLARSAVATVRAHPGSADVGPGQDFDVTGALVDPDGTSHVRMTRTYRGLPVLGGDLVVHRGPGGGFRGTSETLDGTLSLDTSATVSAGRASRTAIAPSPATRGIRGLEASRASLVVDATGTTPRLAWRVVTSGTQGDGTPSRLVSLVDARTGSVLRTEQEIETVDGSGRSLYGGTVPLQLTLSGGAYQLKDGTRGGTYTTDMKNASDSIVCQLLGRRCSNGTLFTSPDSSFGNARRSRRESAAVDAQYGTNMTWDYYQQVHHRNGIFGTGQGSFNRVHYGKNYVNAFWDGTKMTYGDGDGTTYGPLTSLDVTGHEMSHGVTEHSANLSYSGEPGGLNEATSDIFGTVVEFFAHNPQDPGDYLIGEQFDLARHQGFRRMDRPSADGSSANCWSPTVGRLDVHYSSGVGNHLFYLLSEGSGARTLNGVSYRSPTCNGQVVTGIGHGRAAKIWYRALTVYMTSATNYHGARTATLNAARDLYGASNAPYAAVDAAWAAVNVT